MRPDQRTTRLTCHANDCDDWTIAQLCHVNNLTDRAGNWRCPTHKENR